jgi:hypothetical protein
VLFHFPTWLTRADITLSQPVVQFLKHFNGKLSKIDQEKNKNKKLG